MNANGQDVIEAKLKTEDPALVAGMVATRVESIAGQVTAKVGAVAGLLAPSPAGRQ
jgi:hypothetical protein